MNINNPDDSASIKQILTDGYKGEFWNVVCQQLDVMLQRVQDTRDSAELIKLSPVEYKIRNEILLARKEDIQLLKDIPIVMINRMSQAETSIEDDDVYYKPDDFTKEL